MNAEPFNADEVHPPIVTAADDGTALPDGRGWSCAACGTLYAERAAAEICCPGAALDAVQPNAIRFRSCWATTT